MGSEKTTIRMRRCPDRTLWGYVFTDEDHARKWLRSYGARSSDFAFERVVVGPIKPCRSCVGRGYSQTASRVESVTLAELLA